MIEWRGAGESRRVRNVTNGPTEVDAATGHFVLEIIARSERIELAAKEAGRLLPTLIEDIPAGVLVAYGAPDFPIVVMNRMAEALLGCSRDELLGLPAAAHATAFRFVPIKEAGRSGRRELPLYRTAHLGQALRDEEWSLMRPDGTRTVVLVNTNPLRDATDRVVGAITCLREITHLKEMEEALRESEQRLRESDQRKDQFLAILAHELRGPLAPMRTVGEILKLKANTDQSLATVSNILERQIADMGRLLEDLLDLSRVAVGKVRLDRQLIELGPVIVHALEWAKPAIEARQHQLSVSLPEDAVFVEADAGRPAQVFSNLLSNAAKYTEPGGDVQVTLKVAEGSAVVAVRDTGRGLDQADMECLFDLFFQPERTLDRAEGGLGIGLSLVRSLVSMHGETVHALSAGRGKGSEFVVTLPLAAAQRS